MNKNIIINYIMWCKESHCDLCISDKPIWDSWKCVDCFYREQEKGERMSELSIGEEQYIMTKIKDLDFLQKIDDGNIDRLFDMIDKRDEKIEKMNNRLIEIEKHYPKWENIEKRTSNLEKVYLMMYDEVEKKLEMLRENNNLFANEIKKVGGFEEDEDDFEALDLSPIKEICNAFEKVYGKEDDKNEQSIQDIQKRILLKHFIKHWHADDMDYCDYSTKKCTHDSCLDHYLEYYIENKLWDKIV